MGGCYYHGLPPPSNEHTMVPFLSFSSLQRCFCQHISAPGHHTQCICYPQHYKSTLSASRGAQCKWKSCRGVCNWRRRWSVRWGLTQQIKPLCKAETAWPCSAECYNATWVFCLLSLSSIRVSLTLRKWLINVYTEIEMHFEVPTHCRKKEAPIKAARWQRKVEQGRRMKTDLLVLLLTNTQSNNCDLHASLFRTPISLAVGGVVRKRRKLLWICG